MGNVNGEYSRVSSSSVNSSVGMVPVKSLLLMLLHTKRLVSLQYRKQIAHDRVPYKLFIRGKLLSTRKLGKVPLSLLSWIALENEGLNNEIRRQSKLQTHKASKLDNRAISVGRTPFRSLLKSILRNEIQTGWREGDLSLTVISISSSFRAL